MLKKALVLIPHHDDEIGAAGVIIKRLVELSAEVYVCYATNGDFEMPAEIRIGEAVEALGVLGVPKEHIITLGYPDTSNENQFDHIFYFNNEVAIQSRAGYTATYGAGDFNDFIFTQIGKHHPYNKRNYEEDVKRVIQAVEPDLLVCVDMDHHVDHRMLSLVFDKVMGKILIDNPEYRPIIWKAFAYGTGFSALSDYHEMNLASTSFPSTRLADNEGRLDNPFYDWEKRIRIPSKKEWYQAPIENSVFYQALACHKSQNATVFAERTINSDQVVWERRSDNLLLHGSIETSSGDSACLRDFMLFDAEEIHDVANIKMCGFWKPAKEDRRKQIILCLDKTYKVNSISIWGIGTSVKVQIEYEGKQVSKSVEYLCGELCVLLPEIAEISKLSLSFSYDERNEFGIGEIEVFEDKPIETKYIKLLADDTMLDVFYTWMHRPRISVYQYCRYNLKGDEAVTVWLNDKEVTVPFRIPWSMFLKNRKIILDFLVRID